MFIRVIFERLAGKGRTKYGKIITHLDLSGTKSFHGKSGSILLLSSTTLNDFEVDILPAKPLRIEQTFAKMENTVTCVLTNLKVAPQATKVDTTMVVILNPYLSRSQHSGKTMMMKVKVPQLACKATVASDQS